MKIQSLKEPRLPSVLVGRSAVGIEDLLIWAYQVEQVHKAHGALYDLPSGVASGAQGLARHAALGVRIDCAGSVSLHGRDCHPLADTVHDRVLNLRGGMVGQVVSHAVAGNRPDWMPGAVPKWHPRLDAKGRPEMIYRTQADEKNRRNPRGVWVYCDPPSGHIDYVRGGYADWWDALETLALRLQAAGLKMVQTPNFPRQPWCEAA